MALAIRVLTHADLEDAHHIGQTSTLRGAIIDKHFFVFVFVVSLFKTAFWEKVSEVSHMRRASWLPDLLVVSVLFSSLSFLVLVRRAAVPWIGRTWGLY